MITTILAVANLAISIAIYFRVKTIAKL